MKHLSRSFFFLLASLLCSLHSFAQIDIDIDLGGKEWYEEPWAWAAGIGVLIIILLLLRRKK